MFNRVLVGHAACGMGGMGARGMSLGAHVDIAWHGGSMCCRQHVLP